MSLLQAHAEAVLHDVLGCDDVASASGEFDLDLGGRRLRVTVSTGQGEAFLEGTTVRVLVEDQKGLALGYASGVHGQTAPKGLRPTAWELA